MLESQYNISNIYEDDDNTYLEISGSNLKDELYKLNFIKEKYKITKVTNNREEINNDVER